MPENIAYAEPSAPSGEPVDEEPSRRECLRCYLVRMIRSHGCDNTRKWTLRWRDRRAPGNGQLMEQLEERGGICCDCEVVFNVWQDEQGDWPPEEGETSGSDTGDSRQSSGRAGGATGGATDCAGASGGDPLVLCARWRGWSLSNPYDPDDDVDYDDDAEMEVW